MSWREWRERRQWWQSTWAFRQQQRPTSAVAAVRHPWLQLRLFVIRNELQWWLFDIRSRSGGHFGCSGGCSSSLIFLHWRLFDIVNTGA